MTNNFIRNENVQQQYRLDNTKAFEKQFSVASIESIFFYVVAVAIWVLETLFEKHYSEVKTSLDNKKPHTTNYYNEHAKKFLFGF